MKIEIKITPIEGTKPQQWRTEATFGGEMNALDVSETMALVSIQVKDMAINIAKEQLASGGIKKPTVHQIHKRLAHIKIRNLAIQ